MASVQSILVLFGEVDSLVVEDRDRGEAVAAVLGAYEDPSTPGWYEQFTRWLNDPGIQPRPTVLPDTGQALSTLADDPPTGRAEARLLLAIAALGRADPERVDDSERRAEMARAVRPLVPEQPPSDVEIPDRDGRADGLVRLLANSGDYEGLFPDLAAWETMLIEAQRRGFVSESLARQVVPPCQAGFVELPGATGPIASLTTQFVTALSFDKATRFLDPARWPGCTDLWCRMDCLSVGPPRRYLEVIGLACRNSLGWELRTCLEFEDRTLPGIPIATADYRLAADQTGADGLVEVDEGSITVIDEVSQVRVLTVKRLRFRGLALQGGMAALMCALGYASVGEEMVYSCALPDKPGTPWDPGKAKTPAAGGLFGEVVSLTAACVNENAEAMRASASAAARGEYTVEHLARDVTRMWLRPLQDIARVSQVVLGQFADVPKTGAPTREIVSLPVTFGNLPGSSTFRIAGGRLTGPFGRTISAVTFDPASGGPAAGFPVRARATVDIAPCGTFWGMADACGPTGGPTATAGPVVLVVP
jgi:hypothetical protein